MAENPLGEYCYASPAISQGQLFIRGEKHLYCVGNPKPRPAVRAPAGPIVNRPTPRPLVGALSKTNRLWYKGHMGFDDRLKAAILRGQRRGDAVARDAAAQAMSEEDFRRLHSQLRLRLSDHIEACVNKLPNFFPGFQYETMYGDRGWGGACFREDLRLARGQRTNEYSRLEVTVRPYSPAHVLDLAAKGTIRNKEIFNRNYYEELANADEEKFSELIDAWVLEYAELYAARGG